ncbi:hypothetical protein OA93_11350 [Flavobacterium sp. KMS]|nr:hypothetical protein OA93_11350 [Flavobacterium sp. KMS]
MIKILKYLILIRFRKILPKDDYLAIGLFLAFYAVIIYFLNQLFPKYNYFFLITTLEIAFYHQNRKDIELLRVNKNYRLLLFLEYTIYSFPFIIIYLINQRWDILIIHFLILYFLILLNKVGLKTIKYPFRLFDPFWHICFRKNKLILFIPLIIFLNVMGDQYNNDNLNLASLFLVSFIGCLPSFNRENIIHIKISSFDSGKYLLKQIQIAIYNTLLLSTALILCLLVFKKWDLLLFVPLVFLFPIISILFKYAFFSNSLLQQIFFALFIINIQIGIPFLILPYLYYKSIKTINNLKYVTD